MAGYSTAKLVDKLGIKPGHSVYVKNAPENYFKVLGDLPPGAQIKRKLMKDLDFIQLFTTERKKLEENFPVMKNHLSKKGLLWISWPKGTSGVRTDLSENIIRDIGLKEGLVDVKVCAVDDTWSGLKFVFRVKDR